MDCKTTKLNNIDDLSIKEINGQRVVTLKDVDAVHNRPNGTARKRFNDNRKHFIEGVDYYLLKREDILMSEKRTLGFDVPNRGITLFTETGYLMLVKSFTDDLSWDIQRRLVNGYFSSKKAVGAIINPTDYANDYIRKADLVRVVKDIEGHLIQIFEAVDKSNNNISVLKSNIENSNNMLWTIKKSINDEKVKNKGFNPTPKNSAWAKQVGLQIDKISQIRNTGKGGIFKLIYREIEAKFNIDLIREKEIYCSTHNFDNNDFSTLKFIDTNSDFKLFVDKYLLELIGNIEDEYIESVSDEFFQIRSDYMIETGGINW